MKPLCLLSLLAVALVARAQDSSGPSGTLSASQPPSSGAPQLPSSTPSQTPSTPADPPASSPASTPPSSSPPTPPTSTPPTSTPSRPPVSLATSQALSTAPDGGVVSVEVTLTFTPSVSASAPSSSSSSPPSAPSSSGLSTGGIIGLSVAGGVAAIFLTAFLIWKFTRKSSTSFDDGENIKWPELNSHSGSDSHAMPVTNTGRAGFGAGFESESDLSRAPSQMNTYAASSTDFHGEDPYAVPPLPHMNPNQAGPYRDDPGAPAGGAYYDPYRGPVPQTFNEAHGAPPPEWGQPNEAIPMTQMGGRASPGPGMMFDGARTGSPAPYAGGRTPSPGPGAAYNVGRASPGPGAAYGRASPGPQMSYHQ